MSDSEKEVELFRTFEKSKKSHNQKRTIYLFLIFLALVVGFGASNLIHSRVISNQEYQLQTSGVVKLTETQLIDVASRHTRPIYWGGPIKGYHYFLTLDSRGSATLKYIADSATALTEGRREIATYSAEGAWEKSLAVATEKGMSSFRNADGSLVFYASSNSIDVFMAFKDSNYQVEIFDSRAGQALSLALLVGQIRPVVDHETH